MADVDALVAALQDMVARADAASAAIVATAAHLIEAGAKARAPVQTGTLRRSIYVDGPHTIGLGVAAATVAPTVIYARRLELGFHGPDSLGRVYDQPAAPYFQPAVDVVVARAAEIAAEGWSLAINAT